MLYSNEMGWESNGLWHQKGTHPSGRPRQVLVHLSLRMWLSLGPIVLNKRNRSSMKKETGLVVYVFSVWGWKVPTLHCSGSKGQHLLESVPSCILILVFEGSRWIMLYNQNNLHFWKKKPKPWSFLLRASEFSTRFVLFIFSFSFFFFTVLKGTATVAQCLLYQMARTNFFSLRVWWQDCAFNSLVKPLNDQSDWETALAVTPAG